MADADAMAIDAAVADRSSWAIGQALCQRREERRHAGKSEHSSKPHPSARRRIVDSRAVFFRLSKHRCLQLETTAGRHRMFRCGGRYVTALAIIPRRNPESGEGAIELGGFGSTPGPRAFARARNEVYCRASSIATSAFAVSFRSADFCAGRSMTSSCSLPWNANAPR